MVQLIVPLICLRRQVGLFFIKINYIHFNYQRINLGGISHASFNAGLTINCF